MNRRRVRNDIILASALLLAAAVLYFAFALYNNVQSTDASVCVTVDGKVRARYSLARDREETIKTEYGENTLVIRDGYASISRADCKNQVCVHSRRISRGGETIACLPHRLSVSVVSDGGADFFQ